MQPLNEFYFGQIDQVLPYTDPFNISKYQTEYIVSITCELYSVMPYRCVRMDPYGSFNNFEDVTMSVGDHVYVLFPKSERTVGVIVGGQRFFGTSTDASLGNHLRRRFNEVTETFTSKGAYEIVTENGTLPGPSLKVQKKFIIVDDTKGDNITIDQDNKKITINCGDWDVNVTKAMNVIVGDHANIQAKSATITTSDDTIVNANDVKVNAKGDVIVEASGKIKQTGVEIDLNGDAGGVVTNFTFPNCYVSGLPILAVRTVKAGKPGDIE